jgi:hypothetical protein
MISTKTTVYLLLGLVSVFIFSVLVITSGESSRIKVGDCLIEKDAASWEKEEVTNYVKVAKLDEEVGKALVIGLFYEEDKLLYPADMTLTKTELLNLKVVTCPKALEELK